MWLTHINVILQEPLTVVSCMAGTLLAIQRKLPQYLHPTHQLTLQSVKAKRYFTLHFGNTPAMCKMRKIRYETFSSRKDSYLFVVVMHSLCVTDMTQTYQSYLGPVWGWWLIMMTMPVIITTLTVRDESQSRPNGF